MTENVVVVGDDPSPLVDFVAGTVGGIASLLAGHPFDTIKTRLQAQSHVVHGGAAGITSPLLASTTTQTRPLPPHYASALDALRRIVAEERFVGLYKGVTSPMVGVAAMNASIFGVYGLALRTLKQETLTNIFLAGCASGLVSALITSPIELIKIRQQLSYERTNVPRSSASSSSSSRQPSRLPSTWSVVRSIWHKGGVRGMYRGFGCTCLRDLGYGPYFLSYEVFNRLLLTLHATGTYDDGSGSGMARLSNVEMALSGGLAGVVAWLSTFGIDVVKTRVQATERRQTGGGGRSEGSAFLTAARQTYVQGGWRAFFAGVGPTVLRALPVNAVLFLTFEATKECLMKMGY